MNDTDELARATNAVDELERELNRRWYPTYHIAARAGWINDPNGLCFYKGRYHVYFQHHPYSSEWGPMHWGHVSSEDLIHWRHEPIALAPSIDADLEGCWSGSAVEGDDGKLYAFYTGHRYHADPDVFDSRREVQCLATSSDGIAWQKQGVVVPGVEPMANFRDPKVWRQNDTWCMVVGQQSREGRGQIALYTSHDLLAWDFAGIIYEHPSKDVRMLECPDLFCLGQTWVLCFSAMGLRPQNMLWRNQNNAMYVLGTWELGKPFVPSSQALPCDWGHNYYAPQSFEAPDGTRIQYGWMNPFQFEAPEKADGWCGQLTLPRALTIRDDALFSKPLVVPEDLFGNVRGWNTCVVQANELFELAKDAACAAIELTFDLSKSDAERMGVVVHESSDGSCLYVAYDALTNQVIVDRSAMKRGNRGYRSAPLKDGTRSLKLQIWLDKNSVEVIVNDGEATLSELSYPCGKSRLSLLSESGTAVVNAIAIYS